MNGTVHNRAIAAELRVLAKVHDPLLDSAGEPLSTVGVALLVVAQNLRQRARKIEAAAPPATIDAGYIGDEPPVGTVLANNRFTAVCRWENGWHLIGQAGVFPWDELFEDLPSERSWTVLRWGLE